MAPNVRVLVLDNAYQPIGTISWEKSFTLWCSGKVEIVEEYLDLWVRSARQAFRIPSVVRFLKNVFRKFKKIKFSRQNVYLRDRGMCQYCGTKVNKNDFTWDHVLARSRGGRTCWENIVLSCMACNSKKADRTPQEAGMKLINGLPFHPKSVAGTLQFIDKENTPDTWMSYLYWATPLDEERL